MKSLRRHIEEFRALDNTEQVLFVLSVILRLALLLAFITALVELQWTVMFISAVALIVSFFPWYLSQNYHAYLPVGFEFASVLFIYAALILGEVHGFYTRFWWWDVVLHAGAGLVIGFVGFSILFSLYRNKRFQARHALIVFLSFSVALAFSVIWEIFEYSMDNAFGLNMQKSGLQDTMWDLIVDTGGAFIASVVGFYYLRRYDKRHKRG